MKSIPRYKHLRERLKLYGYGTLNQGLQEILHRGRKYISEVATGKRMLFTYEMDQILVALDLEVSIENYLKFFPTLGISPEVEMSPKVAEFVRTLAEVLK